MESFKTKLCRPPKIFEKYGTEDVRAFPDSCLLQLASTSQDSLIDIVPAGERSTEAAQKEEWTDNTAADADWKL